MNQWNQDVLKKLAEEFEKKDEILFAYLYGSRAKGNERKGSDIDVGIYVNEKVLEDPWYQIKLQSELQEKLKMDIVLDIRILNNSSVKFCFEVIYKNPRIFVRDEMTMMEFETKTLLIWYDIRHTWEKFYAEQLEALRK